MLIAKIRCGECGERRFEEKNVNGVFSTPWRDFPKACLTQDLVLPICGNCGNYAIISGEAGKIDEAIERSIREQSVQFIADIKAKANIDAIKLASLIGVTPEYLSSLSNQKNTPSFQIWSRLKLLASDQKNNGPD